MKIEIVPDTASRSLHLRISLENSCAYNFLIPPKTAASLDNIYEFEYNRDVVIALYQMLGDYLKT